MLFSNNSLVDSLLCGCTVAGRLC